MGVHAAGVTHWQRHTVPGIHWRHRLAWLIAAFMPSSAVAGHGFDHLEAAGVEYVVAMGNNAVLARHAEPYVAPLRPVVVATQDTATTYGEAAYQAGTWTAPRRTIIIAEVVWHQGREPRDNPRFVITNLRQTPEWIYTHVYCARGDSENRLKELKL